MRKKSIEQPKLLVSSYERKGYFVRLLQNIDGNYEVVYSQTGQPLKLAGLFLSAHLVQALNKYHRHVDMIDAIAA